MEAIADTTRVHTQETTVSLSPHQSYRTYRRNLVADEYNAAESMYSRLDNLDDKERTWLLKACRSKAWFVRNIETGTVHVASNSCRLRWCPICARAKSAYITHNVKPWISCLRKARFLTLTLKHSSAPLVTQIDKLYADFQKLRKDTQFRKLCSGGVWFFQIKLITESQQWHPHIHCIIAGQWISKEWLGRKWLKITRSSYIVDIKLVKDPDRAASEVARYSATPAQLRDLNGEQQLEVFYAMHRRRLCGTWGVAKSLSLSPPRSVEKSKYEDLGSYAIVVGLADTDKNARQIYLAWVNRTELKADVKMRDIEAFIEGLPRKLQSDIDAGKFDPVLDFK